MSYFQDGLWDTLLGMFLISWGLAMHFDFAAFAGGLAVFLYFGVLGLKRWLTYPRTGYAAIAEQERQKARMVIAGAVLFLLGMVVFLLFATGTRPEWLGEYLIFLLGVMLAVVVSLLAYWWKANHWYAYAALMVASAASHQWLDLPRPLGFALPGAVIAVSGLVMLVRFLRKYPRPAEEDSFGGR